ncbi:MAG: phosphoenolpyruvate--protein phosphotransferase [Pontibacterium sp.]
MLETLRTIVQEVSTEPDLNSVLELIVRRTQAALETDVCSVYLLDRKEQRYRLRATKGLNPEAVGKVTLASDQGLIGYVGQRAEPINLHNARSHPSYTYLAETGEEKYNAFLGAPVIYHRQVLGVLVVQQAQARRFDETEEAFLVTLSAQLASAIAHAEASGAVTERAPRPSAERRFDGLPGSQGVALGVCAVVMPPADLEQVPDKAIKDVSAEVALFYDALVAVKSSIATLAESLSKRLREDETLLFDAYASMLDDPEFVGSVVEAISQGQWAQAALRDVVAGYVSQFAKIDDPYLQERASDIRDLGRRILAELQSVAPDKPEYNEDTILVADELTPSMLAEVLDPKLVGLVSVHGSNNSHAAILARSMGIPAIMGAVDLPVRRLDGRRLIVDGYSGRVYVDPSRRIHYAYTEIVRGEAEMAAELDTLKDLPAETTDGYTMPLWVNTGLVADVKRSLERGAQGIGLYRTEVPFMVRDFFPSEQEQFATYRRQLEAFYPRPVTMRTLDIGGDKALPYFPIEEDNPFLGWRGIRVTLDHPEIFLVQVRAMLRANQGFDNLRIMLPMVTSVNEVEEAIKQIRRAVDELREEGISVDMPPVGVMIEVPAAVYQVRRLARLVDFVSVGSNDLTQYLLAVDRNNPRVAGLYAAYHPAVLRALSFIAKEAHKEHVKVSICGELAAEPGGALLLMAMGYDVLSMNATNLPKVKSTIRSVRKADARGMLEKVMRMDDADEIQTWLHEKLTDLGLAQLTAPVVPE